MFPFFSPLPSFFPLNVPYRDLRLSFPSWLKDSIIKAPLALGQARSDADALLMPQSQLWVKMFALGILVSYSGKLSYSDCNATMSLSCLVLQEHRSILSHTHMRNSARPHNLFPVYITVWQILACLLLSEVLRFGTRREKGSTTTSLCTKPSCVTLYPRPQRSPQSKTSWLHGK